MTANDNKTNLIKFKKKEKKEGPKQRNSNEKAVPLVRVFLKDRDICLHFGIPNYTLVLRPTAAYDLALLLLNAIKANAMKILKTEYEPNDED